MPALLIDVTRLVDRALQGRLPTGVDRVGLAYVQHYGTRAQAVVRWAGRSWILPVRQSLRLFAWLLAPTTARVALRILISGFALGFFTRARAVCVLFNTGHSGLEQAGYPAMLKKMQVKPVFMVHDLIPITHPEYSRPGEAARHATRMHALLALAAGVVANSQATLDQLAKFAQQSGQPMPPATVALLAPGMAVQASGARPIAKPYFVMLSTIEPRKNHWLLLHVWRQLVENLGEAAPQLVIIGQRGWECENVVDMLERCTALHAHVTELSQCSDTELVNYLHHAQALLFPSFTEGYGMPLIEALALGVPVIASDLPVFRELAGEIPDYLDPLDGVRWGQRIALYSQSDSEERNAQRARMQGFRTPDWAQHFVQVDRLLARVNAA
jgi:glycosyltransferase involved in cell wall biosynthesis